MSNPSEHRILHTWSVTINREGDETAPEVVNGQTVQVTRKVIKPVATRMALRDLTRKERRAADLFLASRTAHYVKDHGLLLASELTNRLINTTGGVLTDKEKSRIEQLREKHVQLDMDLARLASAGDTTGETSAEKARLTRELATVRTELINLNAINESVYAQTADAKAQADQSNWILFHTALIERAGRWQPYFEGDGATATETFEKREAFMWKLEEAADEFYVAALPTLTAYVYWFGRGVDTPEGFKLIEEEMAKQAAAAKAAAAKESEPKAATDGGAATPETSAPAVDETVAAQPVAATA